MLDGGSITLELACLLRMNTRIKRHTILTRKKRMFRSNSSSAWERIYSVSARGVFSQVFVNWQTRKSNFPTCNRIHWNFCKKMNFSSKRRSTNQIISYDLLPSFNCQIFASVYKARNIFDKKKKTRQREEELNNSRRKCREKVIDAGDLDWLSRRLRNSEHVCMGHSGPM